MKLDLEMRESNVVFYSVVSSRCHISSRAESFDCNLTGFRLVHNRCLSSISVDRRHCLLSNDEDMSPKILFRLCGEMLKKEMFAHKHFN